MGILKNKIKSLYRRVFRVIASPLIKNLIEDNNEILLRKIARLNSVASLHQQTFSAYKGCNKGKSVVIVGAGPSLEKFKPIDNCIYVGLNSAVLYPKVKYDYLFTIDKVGISKVSKEFGQYNCIKFIGDQNLGPKWQISESEVAKMKGKILRYKTDAGLYRKSEFTLGINSEPLGNFNSVSLQALQFALYTNPAKIYLVGIDCSNLGHFGNHDSLSEHKNILSLRGEDLDEWVKYTIEAWTVAKDFIDKYYPDTEIISVNPIGLKGLFKDMYQE